MSFTTTTNTKENRQAALEAIDTYKLLKSNESEETKLEDAIGNLLCMGENYALSAQNFKETAVNLMCLIAKPSLNKAIIKELGEHGTEETIRMLDALYYFFDRLGQDYFTTLLEEHELNHYGLRSASEIKSIEDKYSSRIDQLLLQVEGATISYN